MTVLHGRRRPCLSKGGCTVDDCSDGEVVEDLSAVLPGIGVTVLPVDLIVKAINSSDLSGFVVATEKGDPIGVLDLEAEQVLEGLDGVVPTINKITDEDVASLIDLSS